jgi:NADP-dependent 3-hydroxy acid dehydrogenase YdfG
VKRSERFHGRPAVFLVEHVTNMRFRVALDGVKLMECSIHSQEKDREGMSNIADKVVVITGASSGIGESTARLLAGNGAKVVLGARRKDRIDALVKDITDEGGSALGLKTDVTRRGDVEALVKSAIEQHGRIDVIVNNSGIMPIAPMAALKVDEWDRMIDVNIKGLLYGVAAVLPIMQKQKLGHIINISSVAGFKVFAPGGTVYSATKFAVRALTEGLRMEHKADNIRCTMISPGAIATELPEGSSEEATRKNLRVFYQMAIPADSVARAIAYTIEQPADVEIDEVVIRPTAQDF